MIEDEKINLLEVWNILIGRKVIILSVTLFVQFLTVLYALFATPIYRGEVLLAPAQEDNRSKMSILAAQYGALASLAGFDFGGLNSNKIDEYIALIKSRAFIADFINEENLMPILFEDDWNKDENKWMVEKNDIPTIGKAYELFSKDIITIDKDKESGLVSLSIDWRDSVLAANWANKIVKKFNNYQKRVQVQDSKKSLDFINKQLENTSIVENKNTLYKLIEMNTKTLMIAEITDEFAFKVLDPAVVPEKK
ncbi:lipopolysaccharide biosynthesis protein [Chloroherpeton thalassium ATCC 35110]|uniref:Lipopolysaccharide biosynthesis protein n=1 Tax=Chloroherpeton thalassium (strain ATCC 35110 / GB-78) TaxID=517418 RepID=B3QV13_CHLT3|nr:Wzz/FepE/Etk N-terminal domain-containing protein [Chloroherpeton thalassium]ACF14514.1 lipopolysaccharide biosynthesis protein [Chloroherpeton thalassium ATCC 35110]